MQLPVKLIQAAMAALELRRAYRLLKRQSVDQLVTSCGGHSVCRDNWQSLAAGCRRAPPLSMAVERASRLVPKGQATCLIKSCAEARLRQRHRLASVLIIGFRPGDGGRLMGHAWLAYPPSKSSVLEEGHVVTAVYEIAVA